MICAYHAALLRPALADVLPALEQRYLASARLAIVAAGMVHVVDNLTNRVLSIEQACPVITFAGSGVCGYTDGAGRYGALRPLSLVHPVNSSNIPFVGYKRRPRAFRPGRKRGADD
jgi:hypothetical protein